MIVFISGPMTGLPEYNKASFMAAESYLTQLGHTVLNPANHIPKVNPEAIAHAQYINIAKAMIDCCDAVYFLDGFTGSKGALIELKYAINGLKTIIFEGYL